MYLPSIAASTGDQLYETSPVSSSRPFGIGRCREIIPFAVSSLCGLAAAAAAASSARGKSLCWVNADVYQREYQSCIDKHVKSLSVSTLTTLCEDTSRAPLN
eukprot:1178467-Prorocentrum_minimum.AAC.2